LEVIRKNSQHSVLNKGTCGHFVSADFVALLARVGEKVPVFPLQAEEFDNIKLQLSFRILIVPMFRRLLVKAEVGTNAEVDVGDPVQLIRVYSDHLKPLFTHGASIEVFAEGRVVEQNRENLVIELDRVNRANAVEEGTMVRLPRELKRLQQYYSLQDSLKTKIDPEFFSPGMTTAKQNVEERKPLMSSLLFIANLAAFLLLAF
jgi:hypothetical protein